jgi:hypothetical protein
LPAPGGGKFLIFCFQLLPGENKPDKLVTGETIFPVGKLAVGNCDPIIAGKRRRRFTAFDMSTTPPSLIRRDFALEDIRKLGGNLPPIYFDELGNMRGENDQLIMAGPNPNCFGEPFTM